jgi:ATP-dependent RNA helicase DDX5/DBP2
VQALSEEQRQETRTRLNIVVDDTEGSAVPPIESFDDMNLHANIMLDIREREYQSPTPIQAQGMPIALSGRDILGCAETGSGKTASFAIPMVQHCLQQPKGRRDDGPIGLVLAPTRELAQQIEKEVSAFSRSSRAVRTAIVVGGVNMGEQRADLRAGVEIVVATPGRFIDHLQQRNTFLGRISFIVLDEADRMLDMGFEPQISEIMQSLKPGHQTLLFSATMPVEIEALANQYLTKPVTVKVGQVSTPTASVLQGLQKTTEVNKTDDVVMLLLEEQQQAQQNGHAMGLTVVFVERKVRADQVAEALNAEGIPSAALHGGLSQHDRQAALADFTCAKVSVLVATDVASRGLDIKGIAHVVNADLPKTFEDYVHRIGRTGRAGSTGRATSFYTDRDSFLVSQIKRAIQELESGNASAFATGKAARQKEKEAAVEFKEKLAIGPSNVVDTAGAAVKVANKYSYMANAKTETVGAADDAWDD